VISTVSFARMVRALALAIPCLLPLLFGCESASYPVDLTYPLRSDPIVTDAPGSTVWDTIGPGQLNHHMARLTEVGGRMLNPANLKPKDRQQLERALSDIFGTPAKPKVVLKDPDEETKKHLKTLRLDNEKILEEGSIVYRRHCMHCHGVSGDGRGPTGPWVNPTPRDYRQGLFKFMSTGLSVDQRKPRREDIHRTLDHGIEGTSMPSFSSLDEKDKEPLISYVIHLSIRGETEMEIMKPLLNESGLPSSDVRSSVEEEATLHVKQWGQSDAEILTPGNYPYHESDTEEGQSEFQASVRRGYKLFTDPKGNASCIVCHVDFGRQAPFRYDKWGTLVRPANLTAGIYRGGRRPLDLYWRIRGGIDPSQMPQAKFDEQKTNNRASSDPYWDLVNFVQALPYPRMLPVDIREEIYGSRHDKTSERAQR
jgi:mono/diheme cytochrome c family protein